MNTAETTKRLMRVGQIKAKRPIIYVRQIEIEKVCRQPIVENDMMAMQALVQKILQCILLWVLK